MSNPDEKQGFMGNLNEKPKAELQDLLRRQRQLLQNRKFVNSLSDKGAKIQSLVDHLERLIRSREELNQTAAMLDSLTIKDDEMNGSGHVQSLEPNVVNKINMAGREKGKTHFFPHRTLRSNLGDLLEETSCTELPGQLPKSGPRESLGADHRQDTVERVKGLINTAQQLSDTEINQWILKRCPSLYNVTRARTVQLNSLEGYTVVIFHCLTSRPGENAEICHLVARSGQQTFSQYALPTYISTGTTKRSKVKIEYRRGTRILTKHGEDVHAQPIQIILKNFLQFFQQFPKVVLLSFSESNTLIHSLKSNKIPIPDILFGNCPKSFLMRVTEGRTLSEDQIVDSLTNLVQTSCVDVFRECQIYDLVNAELCHDESVAFSQRLNTMRGKLFDFSIKEKEVISQTLARRIASAGLSYRDLDELYMESELALVAILVRSSGGVSRVPEEIGAIVRHFVNKHKSGVNPFAEFLFEGSQVTDGVKMVPLDESLQLLSEQKKRMEKIQFEQAKQKLRANTAEVKMTSFDPDSTLSSLKYRDKSTREADSDEDEGRLKDEDDSDSEHDYPE